MASSTYLPANHSDDYTTSKHAHSHIFTSEYGPGGARGRTDEKTAKSRRFGVQTPPAVCLLIIAALGFAIGHHFWYRYLDKKVVQSGDQQAWSIRLGTAFAVLTKTSLVALIGIAAVQRIWTTLRRKAVTLGGIDGMFNIMHDPTAIFNRELLAHAKMLTVFAIVSWAIPLITIITPATLSVRSVIVSSVNPTRVRTVNFTNDKYWWTYEGAGMIVGPDSPISRLFTEVYTSRRTAQQYPPFPNATYELQFWGPSYKCDNVADFIETQNTPTWNTSDKSSGSQYKTFRDAFFAELPDPARYQAAAPRYMNNMLLIHTAGGEAEGGTNIVCQLYNTSYTLSVNFINGNQSILPLGIEYLEPAAWDGDAGRLAALNSHLRPDVLPTFYVTHLLFSALVVAKMALGASGTLWFGGGTVMIPLQQSALPFCPDVASAFSDAGYFDNPSACRNGSLARAIEDLSRNFTISTIAYEYWDGNETTTVSMNITYPQNQYSYQQSTLLITYGVGFAVTFVCLVVGRLARKENGIVSSTAFSTVMLTTRNPDLDGLAVGRWIGSAPLSNDVAKVRMRFGYISDKDGLVHAGFGLDGTVAPMERELETSG